MAGDIKTGVSAATYTKFDGSDYTLAGADLKYSKDNWSVSTFVGAGTNFSDNPEFLVDLKSSYNYDKNFNANIRLRTKIGDDKTTLQARISPFSTCFKINDKTNVYTNLNDCITYKTDTKKIKNQVNFFGGVCHKFSKNVNGWAEFEIDDLYRNPFDKSKIGVNAGVNITF